jgi:hypothetical protein
MSRVVAHPLSRLRQVNPTLAGACPGRCPGQRAAGSPKSGASLEQKREAAQGTEVFEDPDAILPVTVLKEGSPGHESLTGDGAGLGRGEAEDREEHED